MTDNSSNDPAVIGAVTAERSRYLELMDLCRDSKIGAAMKAAIERGDSAEVFAIALVRGDVSCRGTAYR